MGGDDKALSCGDDKALSSDPLLTSSDPPLTRELIQSAEGFTLWPLAVSLRLGRIEGESHEELRVRLLAEFDKQHPQQEVLL